MNRSTRSLGAALLAGTLLSACQPRQQQTAPTLITPGATAETQALYRNLGRLAGEHILFGHHDANAYGHTWQGEPERSDVKDVCGSHPAVVGCDLMDMTVDNPPGKQAVIETELRQRIAEVYDAGGVNTVTWHFRNPVDDLGFYFEESPYRAVSMIVPGGERHGQYKDVLRKIARFAGETRGSDGRLVPMIFRPFHEYDGDWFWWGTPHHCTKEEFVTLWRFTVSYLRDSLGVTNFIYAISPDCLFDTRDELLEYYPGDEYVDLIGMDNYKDLQPGQGTPEAFARKIRIVSDLARERGKLAALTETGVEGIPDPRWWTDTLLPLLKDPTLALSYVMVWRNAYDNPGHYYAPFPGEASSENFVDFRKDGFVLFGSDLPDMYR